MGIQEINDAADFVANAVDPEANIIFGTVVDESLGDQVRVTVIATGFKDVNSAQTMPTLTMGSRTQTSSHQKPAASTRTSAPAPASSRNASNNDKEFDIPEFLKHSRL